MPIGAMMTPPPDGALRQRQVAAARMLLKDAYSAMPKMSSFANFL
jgi:hypothetical protein